MPITVVKKDGVTVTLGSTRLNGAASELQIDISSQLTSESYECMVCFENVKVKHQVWSCKTCYAIFHLKCIGKWLNSDSASNESWRCPGCQTLSSDLRYLCFCGKTPHPQVNRFITPHSCGQSCAKPRNCPHKCSLPCHPGPCPPCELQSLVKCACQKNTMKIKCSSSPESSLISCKQKCGKMLDCQKHHCSIECHDSECPPCFETEIISCYCGELQETSSCSLKSLSQKCTKLCSFVYDCGIHTCSIQCHSLSDHQSLSCPYDPAEYPKCPCGKMAITSRKSCADPLELCGRACGKELSCGHFCKLKCHEGQCGPCQIPISKKCKCSDSKVTVMCSDISKNGGSVFDCSKKCRKQMDCKRHNCGLVCCNATAHTCQSKCGKKLSCQKHYCLMDCGHQGRCHDCVEGATFDELKCHCQRTIKYPPIPCGFKGINCSYPCIRERECGHHIFHTCHANDVPCPPCMVFVERICMCTSKVLKNVPCSRANPSCGQLCKKTINECSHPCQRFCHLGDCLDATHPCTMNCNALKDCGHNCVEKCHGSRPCESLCKSHITTVCQCGNLSTKTLCGSPIEVNCDASCAQKAKMRKLAEALQTKGIEKIVKWPEELVKKSVKCKELVKKIEQMFQEFISSGQTTFYFPRQKSIEHDRIIRDMALVYGLSAEILDASYAKPTTVVRFRPEAKVPFVKLSKVLEAFTELDTVFCHEHIASTEPEEMEILVCTDIFVPNGFYLTMDASVDFSLILNSMKEAFQEHMFFGRLFLIDNCSLYLSLRDLVTIEHREKFVQQVSVANEWIKTIVECKVSDGFIQTGSNLIKINKSKATLKRWSDPEEGWQSKTQFPKDGIELN